MSKQFVLMISEEKMELFKSFMPHVEFLAVGGMTMKDNNEHLLLVTPAPVIQQPVQEVQSV